MLPKLIPLKKFLSIHNSEQLEEANKEMNEHLRSINPEYILYKLQKQWSPDISYEGQIAGGHRKMSMVLKFPSEIIDNKDKLKQLKDWLGINQWYMTYDYGVRDGGRIINIEPVYADEITDVVKKHKYIYHITSHARTHNKGVDLVKNGLKLRLGNIEKKYRDFPNRIYFIFGDSFELLECISNLKEQLRLSNLRIFRIDVHKLGQNISFYRDPQYEEQNYIYSYVNIPRSKMQEVKIEEIL